MQYLRRGSGPVRLDDGGTVISPPGKWPWNIKSLEVWMTLTEI